MANDCLVVVRANGSARSLPANMHWSVPRAVNSLFTGRAQLLQRIQTALKDDGAGSPRRKQLVITGLGGIGKSEVCLQIANTLRQECAVRFYYTSNGLTDIQLLGCVLGRRGKPGYY